MADLIVHRAIHKGSCIALYDKEIIYAGPIEYVPPVDGIVIMIHEEDFKSMKIDVLGRNGNMQ